MICIESLKKHFNGRYYTPFSMDESLGALRFIHPEKSGIIAQLLRLLPAEVEILIVFGSSVNWHHHYGSDLDIAVIPDSQTGIIQSLLQNIDPEIAYDVLGFTSFEDLESQAVDEFSACYDILAKGVPIYVRDIPMHIRETQ